MGVVHADDLRVSLERPRARSGNRNAAGIGVLARLEVRTRLRRDEPGRKVVVTAVVLEVDRFEPIHPSSPDCRDLRTLAPLGVVAFEEDGRPKAPRLKHRHVAVEPIV